MRSPSRFARYDEQELQRAGAELLAFIQQRRELGTEQWTEFVLDWFAATAAPETLVDARVPRQLKGDWRQMWEVPHDLVPNRATQGEFMLDLVHSSYPPYAGEYWTPDYWQRALTTDCSLRLALESEWGDARSDEVTLSAIMHDAIKLPAVRARVKVMVFATREASGSPRIFELLSTLRDRSGDASPWLLLNLPWRGATTTPAELLMRVLGARS